VLTLDIGPASVRAAGAPSGHAHSIRFGHKQWLHSTIQHIEVAGAAAWRDESTLEARVAQLGTPFVRTLVVHLADDHLELTLDQNVAFDDTHVGTAIARPA
jgi:hypothetical protein